MTPRLKIFTVSSIGVAFVGAFWLISEPDNSNSGAEIALDTSSEISPSDTTEPPPPATEKAASTEKVGQTAESETATKRRQSTNNDVYLPPRFLQENAYLSNDPNKLSPEAIKLKELDLPEKTAIPTLLTLMDSLRGVANQGAFPTGENIEVTNGLLGLNYRKVAYLPQNHPRINQRGELTDRWGTPYHFHFASSKKVQIRSAGADRVSFTDDDLVFGN